jgi:DNA-binding HxlR family transcriptional regulator
MTESLPSRRSACPIARALDVVGDKWTLVVLRDLIMARRRHYQEMLAGNEGIASNILASRLKLLESAGMITRRRDPEQRRRVIYEPTEQALDLLPVMIELVLWGLKFDPQASAPAHLMRRLSEDREGFIAELRAQHATASRRTPSPSKPRRRRRRVSER